MIFPFKKPDITQNQFISFISRWLLFIAFILFLDFIIGNVLRYYYFKQESGLFYRTTYAMEKTKADLLIFGSSRANHHYCPDVFEGRLNMEYYNAGRDGNFIFYHYAVLKSVLKRYTPKIIVLDLVSDEFIQDKESYDRITSLLPYYWRHPEIRPVVELKSPFEKIKLISSIYPFNSSLLTIIAGNTEFNKIRKNDNKGYVPIKRTWDGAYKTDSAKIDYKIDSTKLLIYRSFINDCKIAQVNLYIVCSPYFVKKTYPDFSINLAKEIADENNIYFLDYSNDTDFLNNPSLFADINHLNDSGATIFSYRVADEIIKSFKN
jgi:hypothetical protein